MNYAELLTPQMLDLVLPTLGMSILINFLLLSALFFRGLRGWLSSQLYVFWVALRMTLGRSNRDMA